MKEFISGRQLERSVLREVYVNAAKGQCGHKIPKKGKSKIRGPSRRVSWQKAERVFRYWGIENPQIL